MTNEEINRQLDLANKRNWLRGQICDLREQLPKAYRLAYDAENDDAHDRYNSLRALLDNRERELAALEAPELTA